jgi:hypothetical protein
VLVLVPSHRRTGTASTVRDVAPAHRAAGALVVPAKFEEILVVERDRAYWLDDDVPHA